MLNRFAHSMILLVIALTFAITFWKPTATSPTWYKNQVAVLMYHHVHDEDTSASTITTQLLRDQLNHLREQGYQFIDLAQFEQFQQGGAVPDNAVYVTFDDGYDSYYTHAAPILRELNIPSVNFIITETLSHNGSHYIPYLSRERIQQLDQDASGLFEFQCHTNALHHKTADNKAYLIARLPLSDSTLESDAQYHQRIVADIRTCRSELETLTNKTVDFLAYPYGIFDQQAIKAIQEAGIERAVTVNTGIALPVQGRNEIFAMPRINAGSPWIKPADLHKTIQRRIHSVPWNEEQE